VHAGNAGILREATFHMQAAMDEAEYMEYVVQTTDLNQRLVPERFRVVDGFVAVPNGPGLGIELDEKILRAFAVG
jgi:L-rhamnonate dehydratase